MERIYKINEGLNRRFPAGNDPFQIITRLAEECGELAAQVNHFAGSGVKVEKHGEPDRDKLAKEVMDVLRCALQIAMYYDIKDEVETAVQTSYEQMLAANLITE